VISWVDMLGYAAGLLTTFSASPQLIHTYRIRDVSSFDLKFLLMLASGLLTWAVYGIIIKSWPVIAFNILGVMLWLPIIILKIREKRGKDRN